MSASPQRLSAAGFSTVTATVSPSGPYHYRWTDEVCVDNGGVELDCLPPITIASGTNVTQVSIDVAEYEVHKVRASVSATSTSATPGTGRVTVYGPF